MEKSIRNFLVLSLIVACMPAITATTTTKPAVQGPIAKEQSDLNTQLIKAIRKRKVEEVKQLLANGADVNAKDQYGTTALMKAASNERNGELICKLLVKSGADVNIQNDKGHTALMCAAYNMCTAYNWRNGELICKYLIAAGANVNATATDGTTALMSAANNGRNSALTCKVLIESGANVNTKRMDGITAVILANNNITRKLLIKSGADVNVQDQKGRTLLMQNARAEKGGDEELYTMLIDAGADVNIQDNKGNTALMYAVLHEKACKILLKAGAKVLIKNKANKTAIDIALDYVAMGIEYYPKAVKNDEKICNLLINHIPSSGARMKEKIQKFFKKSYLQIRYPRKGASARRNAMVINSLFPCLNQKNGKNGRKITPKKQRGSK